MIIIRVAVYYRMSTSKQEHSIPRQQELVRAFCTERGYVVVFEYIDAGISGTDLARRPQFRKMLQDAQSGMFDAIVCDDVDRFGRFDAIDSGEIIAPLRRAGVWLETVAQGRIDWESFGGPITSAVIQEAKNLEQEAISRRALTGMIKASREGRRCGGRVLYGYRKGADGAWVPDERTAPNAI
ncbi:MAG TPA: recombinase family protein [Gemmataceae bacterium]|nr:recombinase family protein [Gemmataceae bacterium]